MYKGKINKLGAKIGAAARAAGTMKKKGLKVAKSGVVAGKKAALKRKIPSSTGTIYE